LDQSRRLGSVRSGARCVPRRFRSGSTAPLSLVETYSPDVCFIQPVSFNRRQSGSHRTWKHGKLFLEAGDGLAMVRYGGRSCVVAVSCRDWIERTWRVNRILRFGIATIGRTIGLPTTQQSRHSDSITHPCIQHRHQNLLSLLGVTCRRD
jgi:hypothetical protein